MELKPSPQQRVLTWRVLLLFAITAPINCYFLIQMELVRYTFPTWVVPLSNVIFILTAVMLINAVIRLLKSSLALGQGELLFLYVTLSLATTLAGCDVLQAILSVLGHSTWFATEENEWRTLFWHHLPQWLTVSDRDALRGYYLGESSLYLPQHLRVWGAGYRGVDIAIPRHRVHLPLSQYYPAPTMGGTRTAHLPYHPTAARNDKPYLSLLSE